MTLKDIYQFFTNPPKIYLNHHQAVCYVLSILLERESYPSELEQLLEREYPAYRLSDTTLYSALKFLEAEGAIASYRKKVKGRGRPRRMYQLKSQWRDEAHKLVGFWIANIARQQSLPNEDNEDKAISPKALAKVV